MKDRDKFKVSDGNIFVLESVPKMMLDNNYRRELRELAIKFQFKNTYKGCYFRRKDGSVEQLGFLEKEKLLTEIEKIIKSYDHQAVFKSKNGRQMKLGQLLQEIGNKIKDTLGRPK